MKESLPAIACKSSLRSSIGKVSIFEQTGIKHNGSWSHTRNPMWCNKTNNNLCLRSHKYFISFKFCLFKWRCMWSCFWSLVKRSNHSSPCSKAQFCYYFLSMIHKHIKSKMQRIYINNHYFVTLYVSIFPNAIDQLSIFLEPKHSGISLHWCMHVLSEWGVYFIFVQIKRNKNLISWRGALLGFLLET